MDSRLLFYFYFFVCYNKFKMEEGIVFDIRKYSIHDGPGIRTTVFLKGCPLRCPWCHNPEGQSSKLEIMIKSYRCLKDCSECLSVCEKGALLKVDGTLVIRREKCDVCGKCIQVCNSEAIEIIGKKISAEEVINEVEKDKIFYETSGGGVTFSGGEPTRQPEFLDALLTLAKERNFHTIVDTCGYALPRVIEKIANKVDLFLYDLKIMDEKKHRKYTGQSNKLILQNLQKLAKKGKEIIVRIPLIPGVNDDEENIQKTAEFLQSLKNIRQISLLPYHKLGRDKYKRLDRKNIQEFDIPKLEVVEQIKKKLENVGFIVSVGD